MKFAETISSTSVSLADVCMYLSLHNLLGALNTDLTEGTFDESEWKPLFENYYYLIKSNTIVRRLSREDTLMNSESGEVIQVLDLIRQICCGVRLAPEISAAFEF